MKPNILKRMLGIAEAEPEQNYDDTVARARRLIELQDHEEACRLLRHCEQRQQAEGMYLLAWCYWEGKGVREDAAHAHWLWKRAAELGYGPAVERWRQIEATDLNKKRK